MKFIDRIGKRFSRWIGGVGTRKPARISGELRLDFGCGEAVRPGFLGVDIRPNPGVSFVCNAWEIADRVGPGSVVEIYSRHFLEHLTFPQAHKTVRAWAEILAPDGRLVLLVPDIRYHIRQFLEGDPGQPSEANADWTVKQHAVAGFWGWQRQADTRLWDVHKSGYDEAMVRDLLAEHGFDKICRVEDKPWHLHMTARKAS